MTFPGTKSITLRINALFSGIAAVVLWVMSYVISASSQHHFVELDRIALEGKLALIQNILDEESGPEANIRIRKKLADALVGHDELSVVMTDDRGEIVFDNDNVDFSTIRIQNAEKHEPKAPLKLFEINNKEQTYRGTVVQLESRHSPSKYVVALAMNVHHHQAFLDAFEWQLLMISGAGLVLMVTLGGIATRRGLRPLWEMTRVAESITANRINERLELTHLPYELQSLATSFNGMLDRLGDALHRLTDFSSDIAHELRTPINNLMTQTQVSLSKPRSAEEYKEILYSNMEEYERLARMISDMLFLAKADNGLIIPRLETIELRSLVTVLFEFYEPLAVEKNVSLVVRGAAEIAGDRLMIRRAVGNLLSNAVRHSKEGAKINVELQVYNGEVLISVANTGDMINSEQLPRIFDRFYRADASRRRIDEGAGLGLAITRSIIRAHQGEISATSTPDKTTFLITLPSYH